jgi:hypothetical protein
MQRKHGKKAAVSEQRGQKNIMEINQALSDIEAKTIKWQRDALRESTKQRETDEDAHSNCRSAEALLNQYIRSVGAACPDIIATLQKMTKDGVDPYTEGIPAGMIQNLHDRYKKKGHLGMINNVMQVMRIESTATRPGSKIEQLKDMFRDVEEWRRRLKTMNLNEISTSDLAALMTLFNMTSEDFHKFYDAEQMYVAEENVREASLRSHGVTDIKEASDLFGRVKAYVDKEADKFQICATRSGNGKKKASNDAIVFGMEETDTEADKADKTDRRKAQGKKECHHWLRGKCYRSSCPFRHKPELQGTWIE